MISFDAIMNMMRCFPNSYITPHGTFIVNECKSSGDAYFSIRSINTLDDLKYKVITALSRDAYKTEPYTTTKANNAYHDRVRQGINKYTGKCFTVQDMDLIYTYIGNGCNKQLGYAFVQSGYDMNILREKRDKELADVCPDEDL